jgi:TetR/AcrR family transcriptional repressor of nem operon
MARHKEFDQDQVLQKAMEVFWSRGYEAASIQDLVDHMGVNRQSIYDTFGDKHALYLRALDRYREIENRRLLELLRQPGPVRKTLQQLFKGAVDRTVGDEDRRGCFSGNAMSERAGRCPETASRTCVNIAAAEEAIHQALLRGQREGEFQSVNDPRAMARFLYSSLQGLLLMAKATRDRKTLNDIVRVTLSVLD